MIQRIVDSIRPDNCRTQLQQAAEENRRACEDALCILQKHSTDIKKRIERHAA